jgi:hypothetical protein
MRWLVPTTVQRLLAWNPALLSKEYIGFVSHAGLLAKAIPTECSAS